MSFIRICLFVWVCPEFIFTAWLWSHNAECLVVGSRITARTAMRTTTRSAARPGRGPFVWRSIDVRWRVPATAWCGSGAWSAQIIDKNHQTFGTNSIFTISKYTCAMNGVYHLQYLHALWHTQLRPIEMPSMSSIRSSQSMSSRNQGKFQHTSCERKRESSSFLMAYFMSS